MMSMQRINRRSRRRAKRSEILWPHAGPEANPFRLPLLRHRHRLLRPAQTPAEPQYSSLPASITAGEFASDQQAHTRCPTDTVLWVNTRSRVYHFAGTHNYGHTKEGAYMCEADAKSAGDRAAMNESHP
jgi:hypothetical protein